MSPDSRVIWMRSPSTRRSDRVPGMPPARPRRDGGIGSIPTIGARCSRRCLLLPDVMRVLLVMDPFIPVPPRHYGGIERVIADLADALIKRGHEVALWAAPGSGTSARLETFGRESEWTRWSNLRNTLTLSARFFRDRGRFDIVHNFGRLAYLVPIIRWDLPKVQTYMRKVNPDNMRKASRYGA